MTCTYHIQHYEPGCEDCTYELDQIYNRLLPALEAALSESRQPEPLPVLPPPLAPAWATARWPSNPCAAARLLTETFDVEK
jgi:hypothetical protein